MGNLFTREAPQAESEPQPPLQPYRHPGVPTEVYRVPGATSVPFRFPDRLQYQNDRRTHHALTTPATTPVTTPMSSTQRRKQCRFFAKGNCRKGASCTFLHDKSDGPRQPSTSKENDSIDGFTRELGGAWAEFGDGAMTLRVSLPSDFSAIRIGNLQSDCSEQSITELLSDVGLTISRDDVRLTKHTNSTKCTAVVKVKDPSFSKEACRKLGTCITMRHLEVASIPVPLPKGSNFRQVDCRKVQVSWHRPNRTANLFFGNKEVASRLQHKLRTGRVKVKGSQVGARTPVPRQNRESAMSWMVELTGLAETIEERDILQAIPKTEKPHQVEMGELNYVADPEIDSTLIQSMLNEFGPLEIWEVSDTSKGKRMKAHGTFVEESQARDAASTLDGKPLPFCESSKLFVEVVTSVRFKVSTRVYDVIQQRINAHNSAWDRQYIRFFASPPRGSYRVLKLEGRDRESVAKAKQKLDLVLAGDVMRLDGKNIWYPGFKVSGEAYQRLKTIEEELGVVIIRDARSSQFRVFGAEGRQALASEALGELIKDTASATHFIQLDQDDELSWAVEGGFKALKSQLGPDKAVFDRASRSIVIYGSESDFVKAKLIMAESQKRPLECGLKPETDCPICLCEAEEPIQTSCNHRYCSICFVDMCQAEPSGSSEFCIQCKGGQGKCGHVFGFSEIRNILLSETFEDILEASFRSFIQHHPDQFRNCPTPDCSQVYRVASKTEKLPATFTCDKCLVSICTDCHTAHPAVTCAEHKGDTSGGLHALDKVKKELGIQDCPRCGTMMEKTEGCNHMTCKACRTHICWVCLATFDVEDECYRHMRRLHGGYGV